MMNQTMECRGGNKAPPVADSQRRRQKAHSFSSSLLDAICQSLDEDQNLQSQHGQVKMKMSNQRTQPSAFREVKNVHVVSQAGEHVEKGFRRVAKPMEDGMRLAPSSSSSSMVSNRSYSDYSSSMGPVSSSGSSDDVSGYYASSCFYTKSSGDYIKEKMGKAKLRAIKLYSELKKKSPISPRCRLTAYINSLVRQPKKSSSAEQDTYSKPEPEPTSVTDSKPPPCREIDYSRREVFRRCHEKIVRGLKMREFIEETDAESCASSDLFELETLDELPVFETTHIKLNQDTPNFPI
uniref:Uncharacterized protein n=1 Tax=Kalanchoe fedtschenkoi TaxID=63787 RepID=A0A7N0V1D0_KALFE